MRRSIPCRLRLCKNEHEHSKPCPPTDRLLSACQACLLSNALTLHRSCLRLQNTQRHILLQSLSAPNQYRSPCILFQASVSAVLQEQCRT